MKFSSLQEEKEWAWKMQCLAREQTITSLLRDIVFDFQVCKIEGYDCKEYVTRLKTEIDNIYKQLTKK